MPTENTQCVFCEIVAGNVQTPGVFWQDATHMAFLSIDPNTEGFSCVIPKKHFGSDILKMPDDDIKEFIIKAKHVASILENHFSDVGRIGLIMEGTGVNHAHIKLVPMHKTENLKNGGWAQYISGKQFWFDSYEGWISSGAGPMADPEKLKELGEEIIKSQNK